MLAVIKKINRLLDKAQKKQMTFLFFMMLISAFLEVLGVSMMLPLVTVIMDPDIIQTNELAKRACEVLGIATHTQFMLSCIVILTMVFIGKNLFIMARHYVQASFVSRSRLHMQHRMLHSFLMRPYEYYLYAETAEILRVIGSDVPQTYYLLTSVLNLAADTIVSAALIATVFVIEPSLTLTVAAVLGVTGLVIVSLIKPKLQKEGEAYRVHVAAADKWTIQAITGIKEVKTAHKEAFFEEKYFRHGKRMEQAQLVNGVLTPTPTLLIESTSICSILGVLGALIWSGKDVETMIPTITAFAVAAIKLMPSVSRIIGSVNSIAYQEPALTRVLENYKTISAEHCEVDVSVKKTHEEPELTVMDKIEMKNLTYAYPNTEKAVLNRVNMEIPVGTSVGIIGPSGAGKTTVVDILLGLLNPQEGEILADGWNVKENYAQWLSCLSYIPQMIFMLDDTIRANVAFGVQVEDQDEEQIWKVLEEAQLAEFVRSLPKGLDTMIGERGVRLSGGQRQRIGIARALYTNPQLLIFDEATSALDNETETAVMESINSLRGRKTMIIIAHRLQTIAGCDLVYRVKDGQIYQEKSCD